jgi:hypothetical protein
VGGRLGVDRAGDAAGLGDGVVAEIILELLGKSSRSDIWVLSLITRAR